MKLPKTSTSFGKRVNLSSDHMLGDPDASIELIEYGSYFSTTCHTAHEVISKLREEFGDQLLYVYRHFPIPDHENALKAAILSEYADATDNNFWDVHNALMDRESGGQVDIEKIAQDFNLPMPEANNPIVASAAARVDEHIQAGRASGALLPPTFFINGRLYEGAWDETSLREAMKGSPGYRVKIAALDFVKWAPSAGIALLVMVILALILGNSASLGPSFLRLWDTSFGFSFGGSSFNLPLIKWINDGLLTLFFLVVGLEVKREFTVGRLTKLRAASLPLSKSHTTDEG